LPRNCLLKHVIEGTIKEWLQVKGRRGRRRKRIIYDLKETKGCQNGKREFWIPLCGKLAFEETMDLSSDYGINLLKPNGNFTCQKV
jgi:hypothetical protein